MRSKNLQCRLPKAEIISRNGRVQVKMATTTSNRSKVKDSEKQSSFFEACKNGDIEKVKKLLTPENVNSRDVAGRKSTPLHFAAGMSKNNACCLCLRLPGPIVV